MGCKTKIARKDIKEHDRENVEEHLSMLKCELPRTKKDMVLAQKMQQLQGKEWLTCKRNFKN